MARFFEIVRPPVEELAKGTLWVQWQAWFDRLFKYIENTVLRSVTSGDAAATISSNQSYHGVTALTAPRTITLPPTSKLEDGHLLVIQDESGSAGSQTITIAATTGDTVNAVGSVQISSSYGRRVLIKRGTGWFSA